VGFESGRPNVKIFNDNQRPSYLSYWWLYDIDLLRSVLWN